MGRSMGPGGEATRPHKCQCQDQLKLYSRDKTKCDTAHRASHGLRGRLSLLHASHSSAAKPPSPPPKPPPPPP